METAKISVIVPVYQAEPYLARCLDSLIHQSYANLEIILADDGSTDGSGAICDAYRAKDARIQVLHLPNMGAYAARNRALDRATGAYIGFADADDWLEPDMYEQLLKLLTRYDADIAQCEHVNEGRYQQLRSQRLGHEVCFEQQDLTEAFFRERITHGLMNKLYRCTIWEKLRFPEGYNHMDAATLSGLSHFCRRLVRTDAVYYHYNTTNDSITRGKKRMNHILSAEKLFAAYDQAALESSGVGSYFLCREIPSGGRVIPAGNDISPKDARAHVNYMHAVFMRHWKAAQKTPEYAREPWIKRRLWQLYALAPHLSNRMMLYRMRFCQ